MIRVFEIEFNGTLHKSLQKFKYKRKNIFLWLNKIPVTWLAEISTSRLTESTELFFWASICNYATSSYPILYISALALHSFLKSEIREIRYYNLRNTTYLHICLSSFSPLSSFRSRLSFRSFIIRSLWILKTAILQLHIIEQLSKNYIHKF